MVSGKSLKVLVLDDDVRFLESFQELLLTDGHCVYPATRGIEAVEIVRNMPVDLSFLDFDLPDLNGLETFVQIHRQRPELPAVFVTGNPTEGLVRRVRDAGGLALIRKPFVTRAVRVVIRKVIHGAFSSSAFSHGAFSENPFESFKGDLRWRN
jgi:DNA-binding response OmpR family regulator